MSDKDGKKPGRGTVPDGMKSSLVYMPEDIHDEMRLMVFREKTTVTDYIVNAIRLHNERCARKYEKK